jgi:RNA polymerase sigma factor (sigma-70 family)
VDGRSDEELLVAVAAGAGALPEFYRRHVPKVMGMGARRFADAEDVADFVADVFVAVLASASGFDPRRGRAVPWLYGLAANVAAAHLRRRYRDVETRRRIAGRALLDADDIGRVEERIDAEAALRETFDALGRLNASDRRLLELVAVDGLTPADMAVALGINPVAARVRLARARGRLRAVLAARAGPASFPTRPAPRAKIISSADDRTGNEATRRG